MKKYIVTLFLVVLCVFNMSAEIAKIVIKGNCSIMDLRDGGRFVDKCDKVELFVRGNGSKEPLVPVGIIGYGAGSVLYDQILDAAVSRASDKAIPEITKDIPFVIHNGGYIVEVYDLAGKWKKIIIRKIDGDGLQSAYASGAFEWPLVDCQGRRRISKMVKKVLPSGCTTDKDHGVYAGSAVYRGGDDMVSVDFVLLSIVDNVLIVRGAVKGSVANGEFAVSKVDFEYNPHAARVEVAKGVSQNGRDVVSTSIRIQLKGRVYEINPVVGSSPNYSIMARNACAALYGAGNCESANKDVEEDDDEYRCRINLTNGTSRAIKIMKADGRTIIGE